MSSEEFKQLTVEQAVEAVAQMLYDKARIASDQEDAAITQEMRNKYEEQYMTYCAAAEHARNMLWD